jgi:hypothetical protein
MVGYRRRLGAMHKKMRQWTIILTFLVACGENKNTYHETTLTTDKNNRTEIQRLTSDSVSIYLPQDFYLERLNFYDSSRFLTIDIVQPKTDLKQLQSALELLSKIINKEKTKFIDTFKPDERMREAASGNHFSVYPEELYKDDKIISVLIQISYYYAGAAHPFSMDYSFNYNIHDQRQISFEDFFTFKSNKDKEDLIQLINSKFEDESIRVDKFYDFDFNINAKMVTFNFDNYEVASYAFGLQRATINKDQIENYVNSVYRQ